MLANPAETDSINQLTRQFFEIFTNKDQRKPGWELLQSICIPQAMFIKKAGEDECVYDLENFIRPRKALLSDGTLTAFEEAELTEVTVVVGNIAQRFSTYKKSGRLGGEYFEGGGRKLFQFVKKRAGWKISSVLWEDEEQ